MNPASVITPAHLAQGLSYEAYLQLVERLLAEGKSTGPSQSESLTEYSRLNVHRMHRLNKTAEIRPELATALRNLKRPQRWVVLTEGWCGDAAQNVPVIAKMAEAAAGKVELILLLRDDHPDVMDAYLTNGGKGIPKLAALDAETGEEIFRWGPRPAPVQQMVMDYKHAPEPKPPYSEFVIQAQNWYNHDKTQTLQQEFLDLLHGT